MNKRYKLLSLVLCAGIVVSAFPNSGTGATSDSIAFYNSKKSILEMKEYDEAYDTNHDGVVNVFDVIRENKEVFQEESYTDLKSKIYSLETQIEILTQKLAEKEDKTQAQSDLSQINSALSGKIDQQDGKQLSSNDYTDAEKEKLSNLNNYDDTTLRLEISESLSGKIDIQEGKRLSSNDYTDEDKEKLESLENYDDTKINEKINSLVQTTYDEKNQIESLIQNKVDKEEGKQLSSNDYTNEDKLKLDNLNNYDDSYLNSEIIDIKNSVELLDDLSNSMISSNNLVTVLIPNKTILDTNGFEYDNEEYRSSNYIQVESGDYIQAYYNDGGGLMYNYNAVLGAFYDENKSFISGFYHSTNTYTNCCFDNGFTKVTAPENAKYVRISGNDNFENVKWYFSKADNDKCTDNGLVRSDYIDSSKSLTGKTIVNFGDSIFENISSEESVSNYIAMETGANVINCGFGGCRMSAHAEGWDNCSMYRLADDIYNDSFESLVNAVNSGWDGIPGYFENTAYYLSHIDFSKVDAITISYGTNDYREETSILDNPNDRFDTSTVCGALRYSIMQIQRKYPKIQIFVTSPIFRDFMDISENSNTKDWGSGTLKHYSKAYEQVCEDFGVNFIDLQNCSGLSEFTRYYYYPEEDGTHPNAYGKERIGRIIGKRISEILY